MRAPTATIAALFGIAAVNALFVRALHVATVDFPWLQELVRHEQNPCAADRIASAAELEIETVEEGFGCCARAQYRTAEHFRGFRRHRLKPHRKQTDRIHGRGVFVIIDEQPYRGLARQTAIPGDHEQP